MTTTNEDLLLAIDVGTDSIRATAISTNAVVVGLARRACRVRIGSHGEAELDPAAVWTAVCDCTLELASLPGVMARVRGVGVTAALGLVVADGNGKPLRPIMTWQDKRAIAEAQMLAGPAGPTAHFAKSGRPIDPELTACKLKWLQQNEPDVYARIETAYSVKDWILHCLTGERMTDPTSASYTMLFNVFDRRWDDTLVGIAGAKTEWNPRVQAADSLAGSITPVAGSLTGLPAGLPVAVGGPDGSMGALGAGLVKPGSAVDVIGTTDVIFALVDKPVEDATRRAITNAYVADGTWAVGGTLGLTGGALRWFVDAFGPLNGPNGESGFAALDALAEATPAGACSLLFFSGLAGERTPRWNPSARGVLFGLAPIHGRAHVARALLEGCAFTVADTLDAIESTGVAINELRVAGGGATSETWLRIRASAVGRPLLVPTIIEASSLGTAIAAGVVAGIYGSLAEGVAATVRVDRVIEPNPPAHRLYTELRGLMAELATKFDPAFPALQRANAAYKT